MTRAILIDIRHILVVIFGRFPPLRIVMITALILLSTGSIFSQEPPQYELVNIQFKGNQNFSSTSLKTLLSSQQTPAWFWKFVNSFSNFGKPPVYFDSLLISSDLLSLQDFYYSNGFFKFSAAYSYEIDTIENTADLTYMVTEGIPSRYGSVALSGLERIPEEIKMDVVKPLRFDSTQRFSKTAIKAGIDAALTHLENNGYMTARYDSTIVIKDTVSGMADVRIYFSAGRRFSISEVLIEKRGDGADNIEDQMLREIVGIDSADIYSLERLRLSQVRLFRTGLFTSVILGPRIEDTVGTSVPLLLSGTIGKINEASPEIIMNSQQNTFNVGLAGNYTRKNFLGNARKLTMDVSSGIRDIFNSDLLNIINAFSLRDTSIYGFFESNARIEQPYIFNRPIFGILEGYYKMSKDRISNKRTVGGKISFEFELPVFTFLNFLIAYYNFEVVNEVFFNNGKEVNTNEALSILGAEAKTYKANDPMFPSRGYNLSFLFEEGNATGFLFAKALNLNFTGALFYKAQITAAGYLPLSGDDNKVISGKIKMGYLQHYWGAAASIPTTRKFTTGGSNSLRGWKARQLAPYSIQSLNGSLVNVGGGSYLWENAIEFRHRFYEYFGYTVFTDFGNTWLDYSSFKAEDIAVNTGFGIRVYTPFAPVRVDFGMKVFDPADRRSIFKKPFLSNTFEFQFGIGEAF